MAHSNLTASEASSKAGENNPHHNVPNPFEDCRRIQVSREKRPLSFFVSLSKKFLLTDDMIQLSGLGLAVTTVVTVVETLRAAGYVTLNRIVTSLVEPIPGGPSQTPKAKIQMWICKTANFDRLMDENPLGRPSRRGAMKTYGNGSGLGGRRGGVDGEGDVSGQEVSSGSGAEAGSTDPAAEATKESEKEGREVKIEV